ncbi:Endonuclease/exonuclease/phosphatase [Lentinula edodes]|uniref:Endonuclease/exonuclease/phosphatase n=1 Tax=Lentinula lateritia TaxID=40482 RepID=A0A9W9AN36_9AGAR|nr:Endonuclease/exonuclease/phosphatase [Lentinula edodes]
MHNNSWLEDPLAPFYQADSVDMEDADGVSLGSPSSTPEAVAEESYTQDGTTFNQGDTEYLVDVGMADSPALTTPPAVNQLETNVICEQQLKLAIWSHPNPTPSPAINALRSPTLPLLNPSSSQPFTSQSRDSFAAAGGLVVSKPNPSGQSSSKPTPNLPVRPAGHDGRFTSAQKGKKKVPGTVQKESSFPDLLYPANFKLDKRPPKEKAGERDIQIERNFIHIHLLLTQDQSASNQLLTAFNKLQSDLTSFIDRYNLKPEPLPQPPRPPSPIPQPLPPPTPIPETLASPPEVAPLPLTFRDLLSCITDSPSHGDAAFHKRPPPDHDIALRAPKRPRIDTPHQLGHSPSAIMVAPARWSLPPSSFAIITVINRWRAFFEARGASLPAPDSAEHLEPTDSGSYVKKAPLISFSESLPSPYPLLPTSFSSSPVLLRTSSHNLCTPTVTPPLNIHHSSLKIMSWNINGRYLLNLLSSEFLNLLQTADIILLQEIRLQSESCMKTPPGYLSFVRNRRRLDNDIENPWGGVATLVRENLDCFLCQDLSSPDLLVVEVNGTLIRNVYIPPESSCTNWQDWSDINPWDAFVENTHLIMQLDMPSVTGGNINSRIGNLSPHAGHPDRVSSDLTLSTRGRLLLDLCNTHQLTILNGSSSLPGSHSSPTSFQRRHNALGHSITLKTVIDYFIITPFLFPFVTELNVRPETDWSDHSPIIVNIIAPVTPACTTPLTPAFRRRIVPAPLLTDTDLFQHRILHSEPPSHASQLLALYGHASPTPLPLPPLKIYTCHEAAEAE